jgi:hypothetical protein
MLFSVVDPELLFDGDLAFEDGNLFFEAVDTVFDSLKGLPSMAGEDHDEDDVLTVVDTTGPMV